MQKKLVLFFILLVLLLGGCGEQAAKEMGRGEYTVTDIRGRAITFEQPPSRVVSMHPGTDEILVNLISSDRILAFSHWMEDKELSNAREYADKVQLRSGYSVEDILKLQPDVVFMTKMGPAEFVDALESVGVRVFMYEKPQSIKQSMAMQNLVAKALRAEERSQEINTRVQQALERLQDVAEKNKPIRALVFDYTGRVRSTKGTLFGEMLELAKVQDLAGDLAIPKRAYMTKEQVVHANPELLIVISWSGDGRFYSGEEVVKSIYLDPAYQELQAVQEGKVVVLPIRYTICNSAYLIPCCEELIKIIKAQEGKTQIAYELVRGKAILDSIKRGVQPGTAGCSLKLLQTTVRTYQWALTTKLTPLQLKQLRDDYVAALTPEEAQLFSKQLEDVAWEYGNLTDPAQVDSNIARLHDVNMTSRDIQLPVQRLVVMEALLKQ